MIEGRDELVSKIQVQFGHMEMVRGNFDSQYIEVGERFHPNIVPLISSRGLSSIGDKRMDKVLDSEPMNAGRKFAAYVDSLTTPPDKLWHQLKSKDKWLSQYKAVRQWWEDTNIRLFEMRYATTANFIGQNRRNYHGYGIFGMGPLFVDTLWNGPGLRYRHVPVNESYFGENHQGIIDRFFRPMMVEAHQLVTWWGIENVGPTVRKAIDANVPTQKFRVLHAVLPREDYDPDRRDAKGKYWGSYHILMEDRLLMQEGGYRTFPYPTCRYEVIGEEVYPRSPAMDSLPASKTLTEQKRTMLKAGHKAVDPPLFTHDGGVMSGVNIRPGAVNRGGVSADGRMLVGTIPQGDPRIGKELMDDERVSIQKSFSLQMFELAMMQDKEMTATEVATWAKLQHWNLAPTLGALGPDFQGPLIFRELDILRDLGLLPPLPRQLRGAKSLDYDLEFVSPLARLAHAEATEGFMRSLEGSIAIVNATGDPSHLDWADTKKAFGEIAVMRGSYERWVNDPEKVAQLEQQRQKSQETAEASAAAPGAAALVKAMSAAKKGGKAA